MRSGIHRSKDSPSYATETQFKICIVFKWLIKAIMFHFCTILWCLTLNHEMSTLWTSINWMKEGSNKVTIDSSLFIDRIELFCGSKHGKIFKKPSEKDITGNSKYMNDLIEKYNRENKWMGRGRYDLSINTNEFELDTYLIETLNVN